MKFMQKAIESGSVKSQSNGSDKSQSNQSNGSQSNPTQESFVKATSNPNSIPNNNQINEWKIEHSEKSLLAENGLKRRKVVESFLPILQASPAAPICQSNGNHIGIQSNGIQSTRMVFKKYESDKQDVDTPKNKTRITNSNSKLSNKKRNL